MDYAPYDGQKLARKSTLLITHQFNTKRCWYLQPSNHGFEGYESTNNKSTRKTKPYKKLAKEKRTARMTTLVLSNDSDTGPTACGWYLCSCCGARQYCYDDDDE